MRLTIDKAGRVVLPKAVRDEYALSPGTVLEVEETPDAIVLRPAHDQPTVRQKDGLLVVAAPMAADLTDIVRQSRDQRLDDLTGFVTAGKRRG